MISYDFAHQTALAQTFQIKSRNWREVAASVVFSETGADEDSPQLVATESQAHWAYRAGATGDVVAAALQFGLDRSVASTNAYDCCCCAAKNAGAASSQIASRMYAELLRLMGRHGYTRTRNADSI